LAAGADAVPRIYHYRSAGGIEVDFLLEDARRKIAAVEVKASKTVTTKDFSGLRDLADACGERFTCGVVLYNGEEAVKFGPCLHAVPIQTLWARGS
jgi:predicted AAA+ superfamily ATPase